MMQAASGPAQLIGQAPGGVKAPLAVKKKGPPVWVFILIGLFVLSLIGGILYLVLRKPA
jgi:hypothetical protein